MAPIAGAAPGANNPSPVRRLIVLGATGSVGRQTLEVVGHINRLHQRGECPVGLQVVGLAAGRDVGALVGAAERCGARDLAIAHAEPGTPNDGRRWRAGEDAAERLVREVEADLVVGAIVGIAGLRATLAAVELGRDVALANKEPLVAAGALVVPAARRSGTRLLPLDSEHAGLWQCLHALTDAPPPLEAPAAVRRVILTASGGPFRGWARERVYHATPEQALRHPTWAMGPKVTVDCASLMNKGLEVIEAHWLFGLGASRIDAVVHPQSVVHAIVETADGSALAQMGPTDMRLPIQHALVYPHRVPGMARPLDWRELGKLEFEPADHDRYPALRLAYEAIEAGGTAGAVLNAANEEAVGAFLRGEGVPFGRITELVAEALSAIGPAPVADLADVLAADAEARRFIRRRLGIARAGARS